MARFQILRNDMPATEIQTQAYVYQNIDPSTVWVLVCSTDKKDEANTFIDDFRLNAASWQTFKIVDTEAVS